MVTSLRGRGYTALTTGFFILFISSALVSQAPPSTSLVGHWTFEEGNELRDLTGNFPDLTLQGGAMVINGSLDVGTNDWANTSGYAGPMIIEKTLVAWVRLDALATTKDGYSGGSVLTLDKTNTDEFDGIVFAEREKGRWMAGSNGYLRTQDPPSLGPIETTTGELVQMAICYKDLGKGAAYIKIYRNGSEIVKYPMGVLPSFAGATTEILFGLRHTTPAGGFPGRPFLDAKIEEARLYNVCLTSAQIAALAIAEPIPTMGQWGILILGLLMTSLALIYIKDRQVA